MNKLHEQRFLRQNTKLQHQASNEHSPGLRAEQPPQRLQTQQQHCAQRIPLMPIEKQQPEQMSYNQFRQTVAQQARAVWSPSRAADRPQQLQQMHQNHFYRADQPIAVPTAVFDSVASHGSHVASQTGAAMGQAVVLNYSPAVAPRTATPMSASPPFAPSPASPVQQAGAGHNRLVPPPLPPSLSLPVALAPTLTPSPMQAPATAVVPMSFMLPAMPASPVMQSVRAFSPAPSTPPRNPTGVAPIRLKLSCWKCGMTLSRRGMQVRLLRDPAAHMFSTDERPELTNDIGEAFKAATAAEGCDCWIQDFACCCGTRIGYRIASPCPPCLREQKWEGHSWFMAFQLVRSETMCDEDGQPMHWPCQTPRRPDEWVARASMSLKDAPPTSHTMCARQGSKRYSLQSAPSVHDTRRPSTESPSPKPRRQSGVSNKFPGVRHAKDLLCDESFGGAAEDRSTPEQSQGSPPVPASRDEDPHQIVPVPAASTFDSDLEDILNRLSTKENRLSTRENFLSQVGVAQKEAEKRISFQREEIEQTTLSLKEQRMEMDRLARSLTLQEQSLQERTDAISVKELLLDERAESLANDKMLLRERCDRLDAELREARRRPPCRETEAQTSNQVSMDPITGGHRTSMSPITDGRRASMGPIMDGRRASVTRDIAEERNSSGWEWARAELEAVTNRMAAAMKAPKPSKTDPDPTYAPPSGQGSLPAAPDAEVEARLRCSQKLAEKRAELARFEEELNARELELAGRERHARNQTSHREANDSPLVRDATLQMTSSRRSSVGSTVSGSLAPRSSKSVSPTCRSSSGIPPPPAVSWAAYGTNMPSFPSRRPVSMQSRFTILTGIATWAGAGLKTISCRRRFRQDQPLF